MDDPDEMFQLADLLDGVSVDGVDISTESNSPGRHTTKENVPTEKSRVFWSLRITYKHNN